MLLSDLCIQVRQEWDLDTNGIRIEPFSFYQVNPASYDLTLAPVVRRVVPSDEVLDVASVQPGYTEPEDMRERHDQGYVLEPGEFILAATSEVVALGAEIAARVEGKSSLGRLGLAVHVTAGFIDPGFSGSITLEIANLLGRPIRLRPGMRIAQIAFSPMYARPHKTYDQTGHYQGQPAGEPVESRYVFHPDVDRLVEVLGKAIAPAPPGYGRAATAAETREVVEKAIEREEITIRLSLGESQGADE